MKVLLINSVCGIKSTGRICTDLAEVLESQGHQCKIAYGREAVPEKYQRFAHRIGSDIAVKIDALKTRLFDNAGFNSVSVTKGFIKWIKEYNPDIIHLHNIHGYYINIKLLFKFLKEFGKPVVWTLHDCWSFTGHCVHFETIKCEKWKNGCNNCPKKRSYPKSMLFDFSKRNYFLKKDTFTSIENLTIITPSKWLADLVSKSFLGKYEIKVINNGIDLDVFKSLCSDFREKNNLENKKIILGVASAWGKGKGFYDFIKLSDMLDECYKIVLVGVTEEQKKLLPSNILAIEKTNNVNELTQIYTTADVFVNATYVDTFPTVNLEAQACGTPVITYATGGSVESVFENNVVPVVNLEAVCQKIKEIAEDVDKNNRDQAILMASHFRKKDKYLEYLELYQSILN
jgi:glycosyltransferase involved in cell wall biosynthesis